MKQLFNVLKFIVYLLIAWILWYIFSLIIGLLGIWLISMKLFWLIVVVFFAGSAIIGFISVGMSFFARLVSKLNPFKKLGAWILIPLAIISALIRIILWWHLLDIGESNHLIVGLIITALIIYSTGAFSFFISSNYDDEY